MRAEPYQITGFLDFARAVNRTIRQNLVLTFRYNAVTTIALSRPRCLALRYGNSRHGRLLRYRFADSITTVSPDPHNRRGLK